MSNCKKQNSRSLSNGSTNTLECSAIITTRGEMWLVSMVSRGFALQLLHMLFSHDLDFQQKVFERMFQHKLAKQCYPPIYPTLGR